MVNVAQGSYLSSTKKRSPLNHTEWFIAFARQKSDQGWIENRTMLVQYFCWYLNFSWWPVLMVIDQNLDLFQAENNDCSKYTCPDHSICLAFVRPWSSLCLVWADNTGLQDWLMDVKWRLVSVKWIMHDLHDQNMIEWEGLQSLYCDLKRFVFKSAP